MIDVTDVPVTDLSAPEILADPFDHYAKLRAEAPVSLMKAPLVRKTGYLLTRYDDVLALHTDPRFSSNMIEYSPAILTRRLPRLFRVLTDSMVFKDDPEHKRVRGLVYKAFTPRRVQDLAGDIERIVDRLIDRLAATDGPVDLVESFAVPVPLAAISTMLGIDDADRDLFHNGVQELTSGFNGGPVAMLRSLPTSRRLLRLFDRMATQRRREPDDGLITALVQARDEGDVLGEDEVIATIFLLLLAGHDTTANLIGSGVLALLDNPDQLARLRSEPELIDSAVEELLRYTSPVTCGAVRYATEPVEIGGTVIPEGGQVLGMLISANRDETVFDRPDELDLGRNPNRHLAFAFGAHFCLGNQLARLEARAALGALVRRFDHIELAVARDRIRMKPTFSLRGPVSVPLVLRAAGDAA